MLLESDFGVRTLLNIVPWTVKMTPPSKGDLSEVRLGCQREELVCSLVANLWLMSALGQLQRGTRVDATGDNSTIHSATPLRAAHSQYYCQ